MSYPSDLRYTKDHEWVRVEGTVGVVGITHHAQDALGDIVHVELPAVGKKVTKGGAAAEVESVKAVSEVFSPLSGTVLEVNGGLDGNESLINSDPHGEGWLFKIEIEKSEELADLMDAAAYTTFEAH
jgi:glycine cleavage system H protein